jgi:flavin reductase (DIM6/NTAB) family NADH-FMN oxidoreductase RutF
MIDSAFIEYKVGDPVPPELSGDPLENAVMAKPCAWLSTASNQVTLLQGFNVANMSPPVLMVSSDAIPLTLPETTKVTLSMATMREEASLDKAHERCLSFDEMGLVPQETSRKDYPLAVQSSPIHLYCHVVKTVNLGQDRTDASVSMVLLGIDSITMKREILSLPPPSDGGRPILALVDAEKMQPLAGMGFGRFATLDGLHLLVRPSRNDDGKWISDPFEYTTRTEKHKSEDLSSLPEKVEWDTSKPSPLGFNPIKAIILPRPIGWISTYHPEGVSHVAPYSFFAKVAPGMVAFSAYRPPNEPLKDAQLDVEETKCFGVSVVSPDLSVHMNFSSAPIDREESEFALAQLDEVHARYINAPLVKDSRLRLECRHVETVDAGGFSVVIGQVLAMQIHKSVLTPDGKVDPSKLQPVTRLGYVDEYAVVCQKVGTLHKNL